MFMFSCMASSLLFLISIDLRTNKIWPPIACSTSTTIALCTLNNTWKQWIDETKMLEVDYKYMLSKASMRAPPSTTWPQLHVFFITTTKDFYGRSERTASKHNNLGSGIVVNPKYLGMSRLGEWILDATYIPRCFRCDFHIQYVQK